MSFKYLYIALLLTLSTLSIEAFSDILSNNKSLIIDYQLETNELESDKLSHSWMRPINMRYSKTYSTQYGDKTIDTDNFSVQIDQPIFRSGGIYFGIKYANSLRHANRAEIQLQKRKMIADAVNILYSLKKTHLEQKKMRLKIKNDKIDILQKRDSYQSGLLDSSFLDQAMLKKSQDETALLQMDLTLIELKQRFSLLSDKKPHKLKLPRLKLMSQSSYSKNNLELERDKFKAEKSAYNVHVTKAKYLPSISVQGQFSNADLNPMFARPDSTLKEQYYNYGFSISMPLDINSFKDVEASKVAKLQSAVEVLDKKESIDKEYQWIRSSLGILDKKIALANKDEKVYKNLYKLTKNLADAGEKTPLDTEIMHNSLQIRKLDQQIYKIDKQIQLLKLYARSTNDF